MRRVAGLALLALLAACGGEEGQVVAARRSVTLLFQSGPDSLDPGQARSQRARFILGRLLGSGLFEKDRAGRLVPVLAAGPPEVRSDGFRFRLRPEARWPDGRPVLAADFRRGFDLVAANRVGGLLAAGWARVRAIEVESAGVFSIAVEEGGESVLEGYALELMPLPEDWAPGRALETGPGPFRLIRHEADRSELERRSDWWGDSVAELAGRYRLDRLVLRYEADQTRTLALLEEGLVDVAAVEAERAELLESRGFRVRGFDSGSFSFLGFDCLERPTDDPRLRRVIADSLPRVAVASRTRDLLPLRRLVGDQFDPIEESPTRLLAELESAGWIDRDGDGRREGPQGSRALRLVAAAGAISWLDSLLVHWRERLARLGVELEVERLELKALLDRLERRDFDLFILVWRRDSESDSFRALLHSSQATAGGRNFSGLRSPEIDAAVEAVERAEDRSALVAARGDLAELVAREVPIAPLFAHQVTVAWRADRLELPFGFAGPDWTGLARR